MSRQYSVELKAGVVHLPAEFREVARIANQAGLQGLQLIDVNVGPDTQGLVWRTEVRLTFQGRSEDTASPLCPTKEPEQADTLQADPEKGTP